MTELLILCTGNAARSVMVGSMLDHLLGRSEDNGSREGLRVVTAGTHTIDGQPMGLRTRAALGTIAELGEVPVGRHRSRQVMEADVERADLVVVMEADHVRFIRRTFPQAAGRTATMRRLCADLPPSPPALPDRVSSLHLDEIPLDEGDDVLDPAGGDADVYAACAAELWELSQRLVPLL
jgi:protein-tyrosine-phosphatase